MRQEGLRVELGDAPALLPDVLAAAPDDLLVVAVDSYTARCFRPGRAAPLRACGDIDRTRDVARVWRDPLMPLAPTPNTARRASPSPPPLVEQDQQGGGVRRRLAPGSPVAPVQALLATAPAVPG